ncbi:inositol monophosphatase family protein [Kitasatospora sp. NPDC096147]|uniref:inositol monophosphatase family protein n=1 Tax=Kitasatospora sp. NPDC096147 TaxID=3364093 RepID=UPI003808135F
MDERSLDALLPLVEEAVREAAATEIMPRFRHLAPEEVDEKKGPYDLVTAADRKAEEYLTGALTAILPGSAVVGEEGVHADPSRYAALAGDAPVWIVDPVDGTRPFVHGQTGFCTLVALAHRGEILASWTYAPALEQLATAVRGGGAWQDGERLRTRTASPDGELEVSSSHHEYTSPERRRALLGLRVPGVRLRGSAGSAGLEYLALARGEFDATAYDWENAWDHAAGLLLVTEAGGAQTTVTGEPFRLAGGNALPFTAARDAATAERIRRLLAGG